MMSEHMSQIVARLQGVATFTFLDAPFTVEFMPDAIFPALAEGDEARTWWPVSWTKDGGVVGGTGAEQALEMLRQTDAKQRREHGTGFDCVWGFSQGGALASIAVALLHPPLAAQAALPPPPLANLRCAAFFACRIWSERQKSDSVPTYASAFPPAVEPFALSSLHCFGAADDMVTPAVCRSTLKSFSAASHTIHAHKRDGHLVPDDVNSLQVYEEWVNAQLIALNARSGVGEDTRITN